MDQEGQMELIASTKDLDACQALHASLQARWPGLRFERRGTLGPLWNVYLDMAAIGDDEEALQLSIRVGYYAEGYLRATVER